MTKTYTKKQFIEDVKKEARALREHATKEELAKLNFDTFNSDGFSNCVYGQMTGNCCNVRASELIFNCCQRYISTGKWNNPKVYSFEHLSTQINGTHIPGINSADEFLQTRADEYIEHYSALEGYIMLPKSKNKNLIAYLKGETNDLNL